MTIRQKDLKSFANVAKRLSLPEHTTAVCVGDALSRWTITAREITRFIISKCVKLPLDFRWVNNCVGVGNHKLFLQFLFWVFTTCIYSMILVAAKYIMCVYGQEDQAGCNPEVDEHLVVIFLLVESVLFGLFTLCMLGDQMSSILSNQTQIDRLKNTKYKQQCEVNEVFGSPSHVLCATHWIYPVPVEFSASPPTDPTLGGSISMRSVIMGYVLDDPGEDELAPLMRAANASFTSSSPLHPDYNPATGKVSKSSGQTEVSSSGSGKGANVSVLNRKVSICFIIWF